MSKELFLRLVSNLEQEYMYFTQGSDARGRIGFSPLHESKHGFPGMLGSLDCTHWSWRNCPTEWRGQYMRGDHEHPTIML